MQQLPLATLSPYTTLFRSCQAPGKNLLASGLQQLCNTLGRLGALADPVLYALLINAQALFLAPGYRVEEAHTLDETTVTGFPAVSYRQVVKRTLLSAATSQTDCYHFDQYPVQLYELCTIHVMPRTADEKTHTRKGRYSMPKTRQ